MPPTIAVAGATGDLGSRITAALVAAGGDVVALVRPGQEAADRRRLEELGARPVTADPSDLEAMTAAVRGASVVVSALNGLREVIVDRQSLLLDAAVAVGVPRFIPSDYAADYTKTVPGTNRNFDLRREFAARADAAPIAVTSVLNGAFMDMVGREMPLLAPKIHRVLHWGDATQPVDLTTKDDVAAFTAAVAMDPSTPRYVRVAGDVLSASGIAAAVSEVTGSAYRTLRLGSIGALNLLIGVARKVAPQEGEVFPAWQGMQYTRDMFSGRGHLEDLDVDRYPQVHRTSLREHLASRD